MGAGPPRHMGPPPKWEGVGWVQPPLCPHPIQRHMGPPKWEGVRWVQPPPDPPDTWVPPNGRGSDG